MNDPDSVNPAAAAYLLHFAVGGINAPSNERLEKVIPLQFRQLLHETDAIACGPGGPNL